MTESTITFPLIPLLQTYIGKEQLLGASGRITCVAWYAWARDWGARVLGSNSRGTLLFSSVKFLKLRMKSVGVKIVSFILWSYASDFIIVSTALHSQGLLINNLTIALKHCQINLKEAFNYFVTFQVNDVSACKQTKTFQLVHMQGYVNLFTCRGMCLYCFICTQNVAVQAIHNLNLAMAQLL